VEQRLQAMPFVHAGAVRPGFIQPGPGIKSKVRGYQRGINLLRPVLPFFVRTWPGLFTTSAKLVQSMLRIVEGKADRFILESADINRLGQAPF
jgi:hypothetical protein